MRLSFDRNAAPALTPPPPTPDQALPLLMAFRFLLVAVHT
jgi:hypothetical protein